MKINLSNNQNNGDWQSVHSDPVSTPQNLVYKFNLNQN